MITTITTLCDFAKEYKGQLCINGTFTNIYTTVLPTAPLNFALVCQFLLDPGEKEILDVCINISHTASGTKMTPEEGFSFQLDGSAGEKNFIGQKPCNLILNLNKVSFPEVGEYIFKISVEGKEYLLKLYVVDVRDQNTKAD